MTMPPGSNRYIGFTPTLRATTSTGNHKYWCGHVAEDSEGVYYYTEFWQVNTRGIESKRQRSAPTHARGKQGRTDEEQAVFELRAEMQKKLDKGYEDAMMGGHRSLFPIPEQVRPPILPMLAHTHAERGHNLRFPCFAQPKENGVRCLYDGRTFWSRQGNAFIPEVVQRLHLPYAEGIVFDGELVLPEPYTFQQTIAAVKKYRPETTPDRVASGLLEYRLYDAYLPDYEDAPYRHRLAVLRSHLASYPNARVYLIDTIEVSNLDELMTVHAGYAQMGREGTMARNADAPYKPDHRSVDLLKIKDTQEAEYPITGYTAGTGKDRECVIFTCATPEGIPFSVRPKGTYEERRRMYFHADHYLGKPLTVKYQTLTDAGVPLFPVGIAVRDYE